MADLHHADAHSDYVHGSQEISEQVSTFHAFVLLAKWGSLATAVVLLALVLWFGPGGTFIGGFVGPAILAVAGWWFLHERKDAH